MVSWGLSKNIFNPEAMQNIPFELSFCVYWTFQIVFFLKNKLIYTAFLLPSGFKKQRQLVWSYYAALFFDFQG